MEGEEERPMRGRADDGGGADNGDCCGWGFKRKQEFGKHFHIYLLRQQFSAWGPKPLWGSL